MKKFTMADGESSPLFIQPSKVEAVHLDYTSAGCVVIHISGGISFSVVGAIDSVMQELSA